jgi:pimeloyl-ACP methyl ester carboxylesterase
MGSYYLLATLLIISVFGARALSGDGCASESPDDILRSFGGMSFNPFSSLFNMKNIYRFMPVEKEAYLNTPELIEYNGFESESHHVTTEDGYILALHRIPYGFGGKKENGNKPRIPVLVTNYIMCCTSAEWVINYRNQSLGYILADAGYDVWLGNFRGGRYSSNHTTLSTSSRQFWTYTFDEMAQYDMPAMVDYIIGKTGHEKIFMVGMTFGANPPILFLSSKPEYNDKLKGFVVLSPAIELTMGKIRAASKAAMQIIAPILNMLVDRLILEEFGGHDFMRLFGPLAGKVVATVEPAVLMFSSFLAGGHQVHNLNVSRLPVYMGHAPTSASIRTFAHLVQSVAAGYFLRYDWGPEENMKKYGQEIPPKYDLTGVTAPTLITYAKHEFLTRDEEAEELASKIKTSELYAIPDDGWVHFNYVYSTNGKALVYDRVIEFMNQHTDD